jgi:hypothetical protein
MSAYRELKSGELETIALDAHLEGCAACREAFASYTQIGESIRAVPLPLCAPSPDLRAKLMRALAEEQMKMLQKSAPGKVPTPEFLKPYVQERVQETQNHDEMVAFSTAKTGPLPLLSLPRKRRQARGNQFAVLGMAAAILLLIMLGGLTSLLMLARNNPNSLGTISSNISQPSDVFLKSYASQTPYTNIASAIPTDNLIYYTAYRSDVNSANWMLMQFDRNTQVSQPLLETPSSSPLLILSASHHWLVWLEYHRPQLIARGNWVSNGSHYSPQRAWSLHYLSLSPVTTAQTQPSDQAAPTTSTSDIAVTSPTLPAQPTLPTALVLAEGIFDSSTAPTWATTPITGIWQNDDTLLVTQIDQQGLSHLLSYRLALPPQSVAAQEIASAAPGHLLAWPTANYTGTELYWADEWTTADGVLHSNVWQQQTFEQTLRSHGHMDEHVVTTQQDLLTDGMSFQPQIVDNTLFLLSTSEATVSEDGMVKPNGVPLPTSATDSAVEYTPHADPAIYTPPADAAIHGTLFMIPLDGPEAGTESMLGTVGQATSYQTGTNAVLWRTSTGYQMYDVQHQSSVVVGTTLDNAKLLMVNENTTLWWSNDGSNTASGQVTMTAFNWPN